MNLNNIKTREKININNPTHNTAILLVHVGNTHFIINVYTLMCGEI